MLVEATSQLASRITGAIRDAAKATGTSFDYLLKTALRESNLNPAAKASTSSATGLFQFIDQTWLGTLKRDGAALGYGQYADAVVQTQSGRFVVPDATQRQAVMNLRTDPVAASAMAGAFTERNAALLHNKLGREATDGALYIAQFLGLMSRTSSGSLTGMARPVATTLQPRCRSRSRWSISKATSVLAAYVPSWLSGAVRTTTSVPCMA